MTNDKKKKKKGTLENRHRRPRGFIRHQNGGFIRHQNGGFIFAGRWLWVILSLAAIAAVVLVFSPALKRIKSSASSDDKPSTFTVRRDDLPITVTEGGSIRARNTIEVKCEVEAGRMGGVTITSIVPEGIYITQEDVNNGKVLVRLDSATLEEELTQREIYFASAEASYAEAREANDIQVKQNESDITAAELKVKFALMDFKKYLGETLAEKVIDDGDETSNPTTDIAQLLEDANSSGGSASQKLKELKDNISLVGEEFLQAKNTLMWTKKLREKEYVSETDLERDKLKVQTLESKKERAEIALALFKRYDFLKETEKLLSDYEEAKRELDRTYAQSRSKLAQAQAKLKSAESSYRSRKDHLNKTKKQIQLCTIRAPAPGLVIYGTSGDRFWRMMRGSGIIAEGETVYQRQTIISLPDTAEMMAEIFVHESSVDKVRPGQRAKIVMEAFPDKTFGGEVLKVAPLPNPERGRFSPDLKVYTTQVSIEGTHDFLKPGMSAKVEIFVEQLDDVIIVPVQVVANQEGKKVCYCLTPGGVERRVVQTGSFNDTFVAIIDGLEVSEEVLLSPPRFIESKLEPKSKPEAKQQEKPPQQSKGLEPTGPELTDEAIGRIMNHLAETNPEKSEELKQLRKNDPEKFKAELRKLMREQFRKFRRGRSDTGRRNGDERGPENRRVQE